MEPLIARPGETLEVTDSSPEALRVVATFEPTPQEPPPHFHPHQDERFTVLEGAMAVGERVYREGESFEIPRGTVHAMGPHAGAPARVEWEIRPALRTKEFFEALDAINRSGRVDAKGMPNPLLAARVLHEFRDEFRMAKLPAPVISLLAGIARLLSVEWTTSTASRSSSTTSAPTTGAS